MTGVLAARRAVTGMLGSGMPVIGMTVIGALGMRRRPVIGGPLRQGRIGA